MKPGSSLSAKAINSETRSSSPDSSGKGRNRTFLLALAATLLAVLPVIAARHLPLLDAAAHESRLAVLRDLLFTDHGSPFYSFAGFFLPNVGFDLLGLSFATVLEPEAAGRAVFALSLTLTLWGILVLNRVVTGRWHALPLAAALFLYNLVAILGFFSFTLGLGLVSWALAGRLSLANRPASGFVFGVAASGVLLICHVSAFGIFAVMSAGAALEAFLRRPMGLFRLLAWALEGVPAVALLAKMSISDGSQLRYKAPFAASKAFDLTKGFTSGSVAADVAFVIGVLALIAILATRSRPRLASPLIPGLLGLAILYVALPFQVQTGYYVDTRLPPAIALLALAGFAPRETELGRKASLPKATVLAVLALALVAKHGAIAMLWRSLDTTIDVRAAALNALPEGAVILQTECQPAAYDILGIYRARQPPLTHLAAMAAFADKRFVASTWTIPGQHTISVNSAYKPYYDLQQSFDPSLCGDGNGATAAAQLRALAAGEAAAGRHVPPLYLLLIRPPKFVTPLPSTRLVGGPPDFQIYVLEPGDGG